MSETANISRKLKDWNC